jgi:hypothetical protein
VIREKDLGEEHPDTKLVRQNLTMLDTQQKKPWRRIFSRLFTRQRDSVW